jgi:hypothetical protein
MIKKEVRDLILNQALSEISFARQYKNGKVKNWKKNEDLYNGVKEKTVDVRANVNLNRMQEFVHTFLSKIDNSLTFKFSHRKVSQITRVKRLNSLKVYDQQRDFWDLKDIVGKKQAIIYGRAIYSYFADSANGYKAHLENVDVYDFLIDPSARGIDMETAMYMGRYGVVKTKSDLKQGVKDGIYLKYEASNLINGSGNANESSVEESNKQSRTLGTNVNNVNKEIGDVNKYKFWEWYTTYEGERYYLLLNESGATAIRVEKLTDIFESDMYPFWSWACYPDLTEFWSVSPADYVREIFMAQAVSINQMLDNAEQINRPQRVVDVTMVEDLASLKYRRDGYIKSKGDVSKAVKELQTPSINTPIEVFNILETIQEKSSGITAASKGVAEEDKVGIYEGNQANTADRFGLINKAYAFGYQVFARLYEAGVKEHLTKKVAVDILGPNGVEIEEISRKDIFWKGDSFNVLVESSNAELALSMGEKKLKLGFLQANALNPIQNQKKAYETQASINGFTEDEIRQLMDTQEFGDADLMSEAERDIEMILEGKKIPINRKANLAYKQRFVDYVLDNSENISNIQFNDLNEYIAQLQPVIEKNLITSLADQKLKATIASGATGSTPPIEGGEPINNQPIEQPIDNVEI